MYLFEEYYKRHNIQSLQFFYNTFCVVLECNNINHIFTSNWITDARHPGHFKVSLKIVNHNGINNQDLFHNIMEDTVEWNEYEYFMHDFFTKIKQKNKVLNVLKKQEAELAVWELFLYSTDSFFSDQPKEIKNHLILSIDKKSSYNDRKFNQNLILQKYLNMFIHKLWKNNFEIILENYSPWIEKVLEHSLIQIF